MSRHKAIGWTHAAAGFFMAGIFQAVRPNNRFVTLGDGPVAQPVEHLTFNEGVASSNLAGLILHVRRRCGVPPVTLSTYAAPIV